MQLTNEEKQKLLACINVTIKSASNAVQAAADLLPLAQKLAEPEPQDAPMVSE